MERTKLEVNMLNGASCGSWSNWHNIVMKCSLREFAKLNFVDVATFEVKAS